MSRQYFSYTTWRHHNWTTLCLVKLQLSSIILGAAPLQSGWPVGLFQQWASCGRQCLDPLTLCRPGLTFVMMAYIGPRVLGIAVGLISAHEKWQGLKVGLVWVTAHELQCRSPAGRLVKGERQKGLNLKKSF